jgi:hypothetical protein
VANLTNQSFIALAEPLRGVENSAKTITHFSRTNGVATAFFAENSNFVVGDFLDVVNSTDDSGSFNATDFQVLNVVNDSAISEYYIEYTNAGENYVKTSATGTEVVARLNTEDVLEIDTYRQEVYFNGSSNGYRFFIDTLADWTYLDSGVNSLSLLPPENATETEGYFIVYYRSGWIG